MDNVRCFLQLPTTKTGGGRSLFMALASGLWPKPSSKGLFATEGAFGPTHPVASAPCLYKLHRLIHLATNVHRTAKLVDGTVAVSGWVEPPPHWLVPQPMLSASLFPPRPFPLPPLPPPGSVRHTTPRTNPQLPNFHFHGCTSPSGGTGKVLDIASLSRASSPGAPHWPSPASHSHFPCVWFHGSVWIPDSGSHAALSAGLAP
jgi:hypothetical protein